MVKEEISLRHWVGLAVGILGVALVVSPKLAVGLTGGITPLTTAVNLLGALSISFGTVYQKRFATALNLASGGAWQYVGATRRRAHPGAADGGDALRRIVRGVVRARLVGDRAVARRHHAADAADQAGRRGPGIEPDLPRARRLRADGLCGCSGKR